METAGASPPFSCTAKWMRPNRYCLKSASMFDQHWRDWIVSDVDILGGKPLIRGTRISVEFILEMLATGASPSDILTNYPHIPPAGLAAAFQYAADAMKGEHVWALRVSA
jgi:uncharacterized protein (DUF433 family)